MTTKKQTKKTNTRKKSSNTARKSGTPRKTTPSGKQSKENVSIFKEIVFIIALGVCALLFLSIFISGLAEIKDFSYFLFGQKMYVMPFLIGIAIWAFLFLEINGKLIRRFFGGLLLCFSISGILSVAMYVADGGLLGQLNYLIFHGFLADTGIWIVNIVLAIVSVILFTGFSLFSRLGKKAPLTEEERLERKLQAEKKLELKKQRSAENKRRKYLEWEAYEMDALEAERRENDELENELSERRKAFDARFSPVYGVTDTKLSNDTVSINTDFFNGDPIQVNRNAFSSYSSSGVGIDPEEEAKKNIQDTSFIPDIHVASTFFENEEEGVSDVAITEEMKATEEPVVSEQEVPETPTQEYPETLVTASGKIINREKPEKTLLELKKAQEREAKEKESQTKERISSEDNGTITSEKPLILSEEKKPKKVRPYHFPPMSYLNRGAASKISKSGLTKELQENAVKLRDTLATFGVGVTVTNVSCGPSVTRYEIQPELGVKVSKIVALTDDIKLSMAAADIRMEAPIPGKSAIGIEVPNRVKQPVVLRDVLESDLFKNSKSKLSFCLGRNIEGEFVVADLAKMPHLLVAGTTGSGKSVCENTMIMSILYHALPTEVRLILIDPKMVELSIYNGIPHLLLPVVTDPKKAANALMWAVNEMEKRYALFAEYSVRGITGYNELCSKGECSKDTGEPLTSMPQILIIVDELADLMMVAGNEVETAICRLAQKARAAGIHLVLATQRPSTDVITGLIKANIPSRIALSVSSGMDSRVILDLNGAEKLLGNGDMLFAPVGASKPTRIQGAFISDEEIKKVVSFLKKDFDGELDEESIDLSSFSAASDKGENSGDSAGDRDEYFIAAAELVIDKDKASIGMLQRAFKIGFNRAARIMDQLFEAGIVGEEEGTKPRKVLMNAVQFEEYKNQE